MPKVKVKLNINTIKNLRVKILTLQENYTFLQEIFKALSDVSKGKEAVAKFDQTKQTIKNEFCGKIPVEVTHWFKNRFGTPRTEGQRHYADRKSDLISYLLYEIKIMDLITDGDPALNNNRTKGAQGSPEEKAHKKRYPIRTKGAQVSPEEQAHKKRYPMYAYVMQSNELNDSDKESIRRYFFKPITFLSKLFGKKERNLKF